MLDAGYPALGRDRGAVRPVAAGRPAPAGQRRPGRDPRRRAADDGPAAERALHFQEWWVRHRGALPARRFVFVGAESAKPAAGVLDALAEADVVLVAPSNPVVSIAPILAVPGLRERGGGRPAPVVGVSPIIGGAPVRGMADRCLAAIDVECSAAGVGAALRCPGLRRAPRRLAGRHRPTRRPASPAWRFEAVPLWMTDAEATPRRWSRRPSRWRGWPMPDRLEILPGAWHRRHPARRRPGRPRSPPRRRGCATATSSSSPARSCRRPRDGWSTCRRRGPEREAAREAALPAETARPVARRGRTRIVQTHHGFVMASAGIDASNVERSRLVLLPKDPDALGPRAAAGAARAVRARRRRHRLRHDGPALAHRPHRRRPRRGRAGADARPPGRDRRVRQRAAHHPDGRHRRAQRGAAELVKGKRDQVPVAVVRGYLPPGPARPTAGRGRAGPRRRSRTCSRWVRPRRAPPGWPPRLAFPNRADSGSHPSTLPSSRARCRRSRSPPTRCSS